MCVSIFFFQAEDGIRDLVRSRGLGDVYKRQDQNLVDEGTAAHEVERLDLDPAADQVHGRSTPPVAADVFGPVQDVEVILQRTHPRCHLFLFRARQKADVLADRNGDTGHDLSLIHISEPTRPY